MKIQQLPTTNYAAPARSTAAPAQAQAAPAEAKDTATLSGSSPAAAGAANGAEPEKEWTILYYLNGNNNLSSQGMAAMRQLEYVGSDDKFTLAAQVSRPKGLLDGLAHDWNGARRYKIEWNGQKLTAGVAIGDSLTGWVPGKSKQIKSPVLEDLGQADMGKAESLQQFLEWGMSKYPAKHTMVVMMGPSEGLSGMNEDVLHDSKINANELGDVFRKVHEKTGKQIDVLTMDGSATNTAEIAYELKDSVKYLVGSQGIQPGAGYPLSMVSNELKNASGDDVQTPLQMVQYWLLMNSMSGGTISAVDLDKMPQVKEAWDGLSKALLAANLSGEKLNQLVTATQDFQGRSTNEAYQNSRDAIHFATLVVDDKDITDPKLKEAAQKAIDAVSGALVGDVSTGKYTAEAHGLSVFAPTKYGYFRPDGTPVPENFMRDAGYSKTKWAQDTAWPQVLEKAGKDSGFNTALKKLGYSEKTIDKLDGTYAQHIGKLNAVMGFASLAGYMNALNAWGGRPSSALLLSGAAAACVGAAGAANDAVKGIGDVVFAARELKDRDALADAGFEVASAGLKGVANLGYVVPGLKPYAATAGMLMFMNPWLKDVYGVYSEYKNTKDTIELGTSSPKPSLEQWGSAAATYFSNKHPRDHAERSLAQKIFG